MKKRVYIIGVLTIILLLLIISMMYGFKVRNNNLKGEKEGYKMADNKIKMKINDVCFEVELFNNDVSSQLIEKLPLTIMMTELNGNEKYYYFDNDFSTKSEKITEIKAGDIMLYGSNCLVLFYKSFTTTYNYTRVGRVINVEGLKEVLSDDDIEVTFYE